MSEITGKNLDFKVIEPEGKNRKLHHGTESVVKKVDLISEPREGNPSEVGKNKLLSGRFIAKTPLPKLVQTMNAFRNGEHKFSLAEKEKMILEWYKKFKYLKEINQQQPPGKHRFNLPPTVRLINEDDGTHNLLITDLNKLGNEDLVDLKDAENFIFSAADIEIIRAQILGDLKLARQHNISLSYNNNYYPLDTWSLQQSTHRVFITDVAERVKLNVKQGDIDLTEAYVNSAIKSLRVGEITHHQPFPKNYPASE